MKKFLKHLMIGILAFYLPVLIVSIPTAILKIAYSWDITWAHLLNFIIPALASINFFKRSTSRGEEPSPLVFLLGAWIGGPISFIAGTYLGFLGALIFLTFFYPLLFVCRLFRKKFPLKREGLVVGVISLAICVLFFYSIHAQWNSKYPLSEAPFIRSIPIDDVSKAQVLKLVALPEQKSVYRIHIWAEGELDGGAIAHKANSQKAIDSSRIGPGRFRTQMGGDWYDPVCILTYEPGYAHAGHLIFYYSFDSLDPKESADSKSG